VADERAVGRQGPPFPMVVERGKVREFARATGSSHPDYLDAATPPAPPTFLTSSTFWQPPEAAAIWKGVDIDLRRLLHGAQEYEFFGPPPRAGMELTVQSRIESVYEKEGRRGGTMKFVVTVTDFTTPGGRLVARARSTAIETGLAPSEPS
jgi:hypothetical protein